MNFFVTGTDTDVGKTYVTSLLTKSLRKAGFDTVAMKPVSCGESEDTLILRAAANNELSLEEVTPCAYKTPLAPIVAARLEGRLFEPELVLTVFERLNRTHRSILIEGIGGWLVPLTHGYTSADLAVAMALPVLLVVRNRLGAINHTLLTMESIRAHGLSCGGIVLNNHPSDAGDRASESNRQMLRELSTPPLLFEIFPRQQQIELAVA